MRVHYNLKKYFSVSRSYFILCSKISVYLLVSDGEIKISRYDLHASNYHVVSADMRNLEEFEAKLAESDFDKAVPTLFIAECVLVYMTSESSSALVKWIADNVPTAFFISYEQVGMKIYRSFH